ncbi:MAG: ABC transporter ATP-binding protein [Nitrospinota bacterium]|jgi:NitT/TauT family transport system ATP-binding protein|nr:ABC transporter ATP-binding protein [Nitrospinota bacterium]MDP7387141.1 ABC transporter ATP-binding protein [Nitrospinota bacterium]
MAETLIELRNLVKKFPVDGGGNLLVINGMSFTVEKGSFTTLIGPSGCGKSTLLNILTGLEHPTEGDIRFYSAKGDRVEFGYVFQSARLLPWKTALNNVLFVHDSPEARKKAEPRARHYLDLVGLEDYMDRHPHELSGGMQQRVGIARALSLEPDILLMDEPFSHLDEITAKKLRQDLIEIWRRAGVTILFVTHDLSEAALLSDRILFLTQKPSKIHLDQRIDIPRPRTHTDPEFLILQVELSGKFESMQETKD